MKNLFPVKDIKDSMKFRNIEKYEVDFTKTGRLKDSAIPYMQLNCENMINKKQQIKRKKISKDETQERRKLNFRFAFSLLFLFVPVNFCLFIVLLKLHHCENKPLSLYLPLLRKPYETGCLRLAVTFLAVRYNL